ncbi:MAG TPA: hypothetical protein VI456_12790 [Polyangia bacterium]
MALALAALPVAPAVPVLPVALAALMAVDPPVAEAAVAPLVPPKTLKKAASEVAKPRPGATAGAGDDAVAVLVPDVAAGVEAAAAGVAGALAGVVDAGCEAGRVSLLVATIVRPAP